MDPIATRKDGKYSWAVAPLRHPDPGPYAAGGRTTGPPGRRRRTGPVGASGFPIRCSSTCSTNWDRVCSSGRWPACTRRRSTTWVMDWMSRLDRAGRSTKPVEPESGKGFGSTEAARVRSRIGSCSTRGKIENYQVVTPTAWNIGPRDGDGVLGPIEAGVGRHAHHRYAGPGRTRPCRTIIRLSCLVCTVHAYDGKSGRELSRFVVNRMV